MNSLQEQIRVLDNLPGVYQFYDSNGSLLYVGKAKKLKHRVSSYFNKKKHENGKTKVMVSKVAQVKTIHLDSEIDALLLENKLIKKYQPRYNIQLKDDKISEILIDPNNLEINADNFNSLLGDHAKFNANKMIDIFKGEDNDFSKAVCLNAAAGLVVAEKFVDFNDAYNNTREYILSGKSFKHLEKIQSV